MTTHDAGIAEFIRRARSYEEREKYEHVAKGGNWRLDSLQAAVLRVKLRYLKEWNDARRRIAAMHTMRWRGLPGITLPTVLHGVTPVWHLYMIQVGDRARTEEMGSARAKRSATRCASERRAVLMSLLLPARSRPRGCQFDGNVPSALRSIGAHEVH